MHGIQDAFEKDKLKPNRVSVIYQLALTLVAFMMVLQLLWVKLMVPETKGRTLEQIEHELGAAES